MDRAEYDTINLLKYRDMPEFDLVHVHGQGHARIRPYEMASYLLGIDIRIKISSRESGVNKKDVHFGIPSSRILLNTIKRFLKATNKDRFILDIATRLFHVYFFLPISVQEGGFNIHLMEIPFMRGNKGKNKADGIHFGYRDKGFIIVNSFNLGKSFGN
jgi:hypothetical protein